MSTQWLRRSVSVALANTFGHSLELPSHLETTVTNSSSPRRPQKSFSTERKLNVLKPQWQALGASSNCTCLKGIPSNLLRSLEIFETATLFSPASKPQPVVA